MRSTPGFRFAAGALTIGLTTIVLAAGARHSGIQRGSGPSSGDPRWWMREPIRFLQTNLSETDSRVDPGTPSWRSTASSR